MIFFIKTATEFMKSDYEYLLIYDFCGLKYEFLYDEPPKSIFSDLFYEKNYKKIALFKRNINVNTDNIRDKLIYINSYSDDEGE